MKQGELNTYADAGTPEDDPYTETCRDCEGAGFTDGAPDAAACTHCDGTGRIECERPSKEDFAPEDEDE